MKFPDFTSCNSTCFLPRVAYLAIAFMAMTYIARAQYSDSTLHSFTGLRDGAEPTGNVVIDASANVYGTAAFGGVSSGNLGCYSGRCGVVYKLSPNGQGGWNETLLHLFTGGADGSEPQGLLFDSAGNLYGTTQRGGNLSGCEGYGCGVVFKLSPDGQGGWNQSVLYSFKGGTDGAYPNAGVVLDTSGNLYGTTWGGGSTAGNCGSNGCGVVFKLSRVAGAWKEFVLHSFVGGEDGENPAAPVILDKGGNLYGTTYGGGKGLEGTAFKLAKDSNGNWKETTLHAFTGGLDGGKVIAGLVQDASGNLYGTTLFGAACCGVVFQLSLTANGAWQENVLYSFTGKFDGAVPYAPLILDTSGNLYGTTEGGGNFTCINNTQYCGIVFKLSPSTSNWSESVVYAFSGEDGANPVNGLTFDASGNLFGTARFGGTSYKACAGQGCGVVFELAP
jgi:uncharacterized repeat protein (TIGR03803 family)